VRVLLIGLIVSATYGCCRADMPEELESGRVLTAEDGKRYYVRRHGHTCTYVAYELEK
jgi:hypothetical protein